MTAEVLGYGVLSKRKWKREVVVCNCWNDRDGDVNEREREKRNEMNKEKSESTKNNILMIWRTIKGIYCKVYLCREVIRSLVPKYRENS
jgi:hypothetical protein